MNNFRRFAIASVALALGMPAFAQTVDTAPPASSETAVPARPTTPVGGVVITGGAKAVAPGSLYSNGPYLAVPGPLPTGQGGVATQLGVGTGGADVSELYTTQSYNTYGWGAQSTIPNIMADDFVVCNQVTDWDVDAVRWLFYQTGAPTSGTITGMDINVSAGSAKTPGSQDWQLGDIYSSHQWSGAYRVLDSDLTAVNRALIEVVSSDPSTAGLPVLTPGAYWIDGSAAGSLPSGPWTPPLTAQEMANDNTFGAAAGYNAQQSVGGAPFGGVSHSGNGDPVDMCFWLDGTENGGTCAGGTGPGAFCSPQTGNGLGTCGSIGLSAGSATASKGGGSGTYNITTTPIQGPSIGLMLYGKLPPTPPLQLQYGDLCVQPFFRAKDHVQVIPASTGCSTNYVLDAGLWINYYANINVGDNIIWQFWLRDSGAPNTAVWTEGLGPVQITL